MNVKREEECYDASTDDKGGALIDQLMLKEVVVKKEEDVDTDDEMQAAEKSGQDGGSSGGFEKRLEELKAYKSKRGHLKVKKSEDKSLARFCINIRSARRGTGNMKLTEERIASLDTLGFDWEPKRQQDQRSSDAFERRLGELKAYRVEHGHLNVKKSEDTSLAVFCKDIRAARRGKGSHLLTTERIASLDALGFEWEPNGKSKRDSSFQERLEELTAYKSKHGHLIVKKSENKSLYRFCERSRGARRNPGSSEGIRLTEDRIAALDALGFDWAPQGKGRPNERSFQEKVEELRAYKEEHGHLKVKRRDDKSLAIFCDNVRQARRGKGGRKLNEDRIGSLDAIGFDWKMLPEIGNVESEEQSTERILPPMPNIPPPLMPGSDDIGIEINK